MASSQRAAGAVSSGRPEATGPRPVDVRAVRVGPLPSRLPCDCRRVEHGGGARSPRGHAEARGELAGLSSGPRLVPGLPCLHPVRPSALGAAPWRPCKKQHPETQPEGACLPALGHPRAGTSSYFRVFVSRGAAFTGAGGCPVLSVGGPAPPHNEPSRGGCRPQDPPLGLDSGPLLHSEARGQPPARATWQRPGSCPSGGPGGGVSWGPGAVACLSPHPAPSVLSAVNFDHFQILRAIGKGSFGKVRRVGWAAGSLLGAPLCPLGCWRGRGCASRPAGL